MVIQTPSITVHEFEDFIARPENAHRLFELIHGEIIEKMPTQVHGIIALNGGSEFNFYFRQNPIGFAAVEARHRPTDDPTNDRLPDISVVLDVTKAPQWKGAANYIPDICVEIKSPDDSYQEMKETAQFYLDNGAKLVWLVYPERRLVETLTKDSRDLIGEDGVLITDLLPGFSMQVSDLFRGI